MCVQVQVKERGDPCSSGAVDRFSHWHGANTVSLKDLSDRDLPDRDLPGPIFQFLDYKHEP